jgi:peptidoglycan biosynthesis protein MviN/MurJ (putative lipid II flippase)
MEKSRLMFLVLAVCGTACVLVSLFAITHLYHEHAAQLAEGEKNFIPFLFFVAIPSFAGIVIGAVMIVKGVSIGLRDKS